MPVDRPYTTLDKINLTEAAVQDLFQKLIGPCSRHETGEWNVEGVTVESVDGFLIVSRVYYSQSGVKVNGEGKSLIQLFEEKGYRLGVVNSRLIRVMIPIADVKEQQGDDSLLLRVQGSTHSSVLGVYGRKK